MSEEGVPTPEKKSHTGLIIGIVLTVIVVLLALFFGLYFGLRNKGDDIPDEVNPDPDIVEPGPEDPDSTGDDTPEHSEHTWVWEHDEEGHWQVCSVCGETTTKEDHNLTYTEEDSTYHLVACDICGYEATDEHTWVWEHDEEGHWQVCEVCGETTTKEDHELTYTIEDSDYHISTCDICGYEVTEAHTFTAVVTSPTCTDGGYTTYTCECGYSYTGDETSALGHEWGNWTDNGSDETHTKTCSRCNDTETQDHDYSETYILKVKDTSTLTYTYTCETCGHIKEVDEVHTYAFSTDSWEVIDAVAASGLANQIYTVGDTKTIYVGEEEHSVRIIGFNHDTLTTNSDSSYNNNSGTAAITCEMVDCLSTTHYVTSGSGYNGGGWYSSAMRKYLNTEEGCVLSTLNEDLQSVIKQVDKKSTAGANSTALGDTASDSLFLLAEVEVDATNTEGYKDEGTQYTYWKNNYSAAANRIKNLNGSANAWWLRSPRTGTQNNWQCVDASGSIAGDSSSNAKGVSFAFCI